MSELTVLIPTYNRPDILPQTIGWLNDHLDFDGKIHILVGNDGDMNHATFGYHPKNVTELQGPRRGLGANLNMLLRAAKTDIVLQMDDDHHLVKPLDITQYVKDLEEQRDNIGWVRLFIGTEEDLNNDDPFYKFEARMVGRYWIPDPAGPELYIASNRSHLKHKRFHNVYGLYKEGVSLGETEAGFCHTYSDRQRLSEVGLPWVAIPVAAPSFDTWQHVGQSWQGTTHDR